MNRARRGLTIGLAAVTTLALAGGIAYATIPGTGNVFSACMLKGVGTIRLIDKSLPSTNLMSRCTDREVEISWNHTGPPGPPGPQGVQGDEGAEGPTGDQGPAGPAGGTAVSFGETVVLNGDPNVLVYEDLSIGTITVGCLPIDATLYPQVEYTNTTSTTKAVDLLTGSLSHPRTVAPGATAFLREDGRSVIGPDSIPGSTRASDHNRVAVHSPFAIVDVVSRLPFPVTVPGIGGSAPGCGYLVTVTRST